ncbi:Fe2+-dicitrate sensor, membrane component [Piscinibacter sakaiensis]|uniref:Fe2+-dicitrate sensor, membrane component n=1 Tax=Piscinibacter sakaiensis TaxID=1547922 RepID=A0A0K8P7P1_PISS1|nr:Fe2+-dicitrate sensor, membrane component [Piscinibacter sakaiensis]
MIEAEAAVWIAMLHGPNRTRQMELNCLDWQRRSAAHRQAFERCTEIWELAGGVSAEGVARAAVHGARGGGADAGSGATRSARRSVLALAGTLAGAVVLGVAWQAWQARGVFQTGVGEQQVAVLSDGSRLSLNTATRVRVSMSGSLRELQLEYGEAYFEVAKETRPFVVRAGDRQVVALGTAFVVRWEGAAADAGAGVVVTLVQGQVRVQPAKAAVAPMDAGYTMRPGERLRLPAHAGVDRSAAPAVDRPPIERVTAWTRNEAIFDGTPLADAVAEMNRYSRTPIVLQGGGALDARRISGVFRTGDNEAFIASVAAIHRLGVRRGNGRIELFPNP